MKPTKIILTDEQIDFIKGSLSEMKDAAAAFNVASQNCRLSKDRLWRNLHGLFPEIRKTGIEDSTSFTHPNDTRPDEVQEYYIQYFTEEDRLLLVNIKCTEGDWTTGLTRNMKVKDAIDVIREHFGYVIDGQYELHLNDGDAMQREETLIDCGVSDGDLLLFSDLGSTV